MGNTVKELIENCKQNIKYQEETIEIINTKLAGEKMSKKDKVALLKIKERCERKIERYKSAIKGYANQVNFA